MSVRTGDGGERLPWLEAVEEEDEEPTGGFGRLLVVFVGVLAAVALVAGGIALWRQRQQATADLGGIIRAPTGPYKVRPRDPGGMKVAGAGDVAYGTSTGQDIDSAIDLGAMPETPLAGPGSEPRQEATVPPRPTLATAPAVPVPAPKETQVAAAPPKADAAPAPANGPEAVIQLGAFSSEAKARAAWKSLSGRYASLAGLSNSITQVTASDAPTLYRLRASGPGAGKVCAALKVAGETCSKVGG